MHKLLSLVLSASILFSSVTPTLGGGVPVRRGRPVKARREASRRFSARKVLARVERAQSNFSLREEMRGGRTNNAATYILESSGSARIRSMRRDFVTLSLNSGKLSKNLRNKGISHYKTQLKDARSIFQLADEDLKAFITESKQSQTSQSLAKAQGVLSDGSALSLVVTREQAAELLKFYEQAKGTSFEDTALLITARGLLRVEAYDELGALLAENGQNPVLAGMAQYIKVHEVPVEVPAFLEGCVAPAVNSQIASLLEVDFEPNRLHADPSLRATERWMELGRAQKESVPSQGIEPRVQIREEIPAPKMAQGLSTSGSATQAETEVTSTLENGKGVAASQDFAPKTEPVRQEAVTTSGQTTPGQITPAPQTAAAKKNPSASSRSGIVYGGIPFFAIVDSGKRRISWLRNKFSKKSKKEAPYEEPGLHDKTTQPIYEEGSVPEIMRDGEDVSVVNNDIRVMVGMEGFKLTVENSDGAEDILHNVNLTLSAKLKHFSPEYNRLALDGKGVFELRNLTMKGQRPDHFYFVLSTRKGEFALLAQGANQLGLSRPVRVKIQRTTSPRQTVTLPVYDITLKKTAVIAEVDMALLRDVKDIEGGQIVFHENKLYFRNAQGDIMTPLLNCFVRLPKEESKYWTKIFAMNPQTKFSVSVLSTKDKMPPLTYLVPVLQIGLGKTMGPVLKEYSNWGETEATYTMMGINNGLTAAMIFVNPLLERYGEAKVYRLGVGALAASALGAIASGLYGHIEGTFSGPQLAAFLTSSTLMALGVSVTRYLQGLLILANRGIVREGKTLVNTKTGKKVDVVYDGKHFWKRVKEVFTKKSERSLIDVLHLQKAAMYKNLGTMLFLAFPWLANLTGKAFGLDLGLDFSASYVPYSLFSLYTLYKVYKTPFKNSFPLDITMLHNNFKDLQGKVLPQIAKMDPKEIKPEDTEVKEIAKSVKSSIDALVPVEARKTKKAPKGLALRYEAEFLDTVEKFLTEKGRSAEEAKAVRDAFQKTFDELGHRNVKFKDVMLKAGLPPALTAMTLATIGELGFSNNFAFAMRELVGSATAATGIVGLLLYGFMFTWRVFGNFLSQRMSGGSMYAVSSATAVLGPLMMAMSHGNMTALVTGAIISCFGISNFFAQMYDYIIKLHPQYKREVALGINLTMPLAALGAPLLRLASNIEGLDNVLVSLAMAGSVALTPKMLADSSLVQGIKHSWRHNKERLNKLFHRDGKGGDQPPLDGGEEPPLIENPAQ